MKLSTSSFRFVVVILFSSFIISECSVNGETRGTNKALVHARTQILALDEAEVPTEKQIDAKDALRVTLPETDKKDDEKHVVKRHVQEVESDIRCSEVQAPEGPGIHMIREIKNYEHSFYFKPQRNFKKFVIQMIIDNELNVNDPYISDEEIVFSTRDFQNTSDDAWLEVRVEYFTHQVHMGRDKLALRVTIRNESRLLITPRWWRTHSYKGFQVSVEGGASFLFDCVSSAAVLPNPSVSTLNKPLLLGGILGACFLLVIGGWAWYLIIRHHPRQSRCDEHPPSVPPLPASLLLGKVNKCPDPEHIYEEFDEETLARLRQKMNPETLGKCGDALGVKSKTQDYDVPLRTRPYRDTASSEREMASGCGPDPVYLNEINMSLIEEKMKASLRTSLPESHYVEMHGIINKYSQDFGQ